MGLIKKIWNGELPLVKVYWLYGVVFGAFVAIFSVLIKDYPTALILLTFALIPYQILVFVGIWRSANAYTNKKVWAVLAKVHVVLGVIAALNGVAVVSKNLNFNQSQISPIQNTANYELKSNEMIVTSTENPAISNYRLRGPDNKTYSIDGPVGASRREVIDVMILKDEDQTKWKDFN